MHSVQSTTQPTNSTCQMVLRPVIPFLSLARIFSSGPASGAAEAPPTAIIVKPVKTILTPLHPGNVSIFKPLTARHIDRIGSFLDLATLISLYGSCRRMRWIFQARIKMMFFFSSPARRVCIGPSIGLSIVYSVNDLQPRLIKIVDSKPEYYTAKWDAVLLDDGEVLGQIQIGWVRPKGNDGTYGYEDMPSVNFQLPYGEEATKQQKQAVFIEDLTGSKKYIGVGTALMQAGGMEFGLIQKRSCEMRLYLTAAWKSHGFYWSLGMRSDKPGINAELTQLLVRAWKRTHKMQLTEHYTCPTMFLTAEAATKWRLRIRQDPILYETRAQLCS